MSLRDYLKANMFDGQEEGTQTQLVSTLLDDITELVALWMIEESGNRAAIEAYYQPGRYLPKSWNPDPDEYLLDDQPVVCIAHLTFVPCRHGGIDDPHWYSTKAEDVEKTRQYQQGDK